MRLVWKSKGAIAPGGTVLGVIAGSHERSWLVTEAGIWHTGDGPWQPLLINGRHVRANALLDLPGSLVVAEASGGLRYSPDHGQHWYRAWDDDVTSPITCFAGSPASANRSTLLAGTAAAGILRSSDGGRRWSLVNVGLHDYSILALAMAPVWAERELVFAATADGVYRSPNGGRAWKRANAGIEGLVMQALALSPGFSSDTTLCAGSDDGRLFWSNDQGQTWMERQTLAEHVPINGLCWLPDGWLVAGLADGRIIRSADQGQTWETIDLGGMLFTLAQIGERLYAGMFDQGLAYSDDAGATWVYDQSLIARDLTRFVRVPPGQVHTPVGGVNHAMANPHQHDPSWLLYSVVAYGATGGIWQAHAQDWQKHAEPELTDPLALLVATDQGLVAAAGAMLLVLGSDNQWTIHATLPAGQIVTLTADPHGSGQLWCATDQGKLWRVGVDGTCWPVPAELPTGEEPLTMTCAGHVPVLATIDRSARRIRIWQLLSDPVRWSRWLECISDWDAVQFLLATNASVPDLIAIGAFVWRRDGSSWYAQALDQTPILRLFQVPGTLQILAITEQHVWSSIDGLAWDSQELLVPTGGLLDLALRETLPPGLLGLGPGGMLWATEPDLADR